MFCGRKPTQAWGEHAGTTIPQIRCPSRTALNMMRLWKCRFLISCENAASSLWFVLKALIHEIISNNQNSASLALNLRFQHFDLCMTVTVKASQASQRQLSWLWATVCVIECSVPPPAHAFYTRKWICGDLWDRQKRKCEVKKSPLSLFCQIYSESVCQSLVRVLSQLFTLSDKSAKHEVIFLFKSLQVKLWSIFNSNK